MEACALRTEILGVGFDDLTIEEAADRASALLEEEGFHYVVNPQPGAGGPGPAGGDLPGGP